MSQVARQHYSSDEPERESPDHLDDDDDVPQDLQAMMDGQLRLQQQAERLAKRMVANNAIMEGQRRLEKQLEMMARQMGSPRDGAPRRGEPRQWKAAARQSPAQERPRQNMNFREPSGDAEPDVEGQDDVYDDEHDYRMPTPTSKGKSPHKASNHKNGYHSDDHAQQERDGHDEDGHHDKTPTARSTLRMLSMRRNDTLARLHGDSPIYYAAWMAEWITCFLFTLAHLIMLILWARHDGNQDSYVTTLFVTAIAAATYFAKACHMGDFTINGIVVPLPRYIDWLTTTPLMLYELCHIAHASFGSTFMVILCDVLMIATGMIEAMIPWRPHKGIKQIWFLISCWFFILMLLVIQFDVAKKAEKQNEVARNLFEQLKILTVVVWSLYPIIVGIGRANTALITKPIEDIALCFMDVVAKIGMEGLIVAACFQGCLDKSGGGH